MKKSTGYLNRIMMALSAFILALSIPITVLADGDFYGSITITGTVKEYEYKAYEVLECIGVGGEDSVYMSKGNWKEFLSTNENAAEMLIPAENDGNYAVDEGSDLYTVNLESSKEVRRAFAADALEYAKENGIDAYESIKAEAREVKFVDLPLGIYVIDTADRARITVMWDMGWESEIKESYKPETEEKTETQQAAVNNTEESIADEDVETATPKTEAESEEKAVEEPLTAGEEVPKTNSIFPAVTVIAAVVLAAAAVLLFVKRKK